jgi:hypothetical protein
MSTEFEAKLISLLLRFVAAYERHSEASVSRMAEMSHDDEIRRKRWILEKELDDRYRLTDEDMAARKANDEVVYEVNRLNLENARRWGLRSWADLDSTYGHGDDLPKALADAERLRAELTALEQRGCVLAEELRRTLNERESADRTSK